MRVDLGTRVRSRLQRLRRWNREARWRRAATSSAYVRYAVLPGLVMDLPATSDLSRMVFVDDLEGVERRLLRQLLRPGDVFVDVGANFGLYTIDASKLIGESGSVLAFEPSPDAYGHLQHNISLAGVRNVDVRQLALSDSDGTAVLKTSRDGRDAWNTLGQSLHGGQVDSQRVTTARLDDVLAALLPMARPTMMKIDVEGWECHVLRGAERLLGRADAPILQVEFAPKYFEVNGSHISALRHEILRHGYDLFNAVNAQSMRPHDNVCGTLDGNLYAAKSSSPWSERIKALLV